MSRPWLRLLGSGLAGLGLLMAGFSAWLFLELLGRANDRIQNGRPVDAIVMSVKHRGFGIWGGQEVSVAYQSGGYQYHARLMSVWSERKTGFSTPLRVYMNASDPTEVATEDQYVSEGFLTAAPSTIIAFSVPIMIVGLHCYRRAKESKLRMISGEVDGKTTYVQVDFPIDVRGYDIEQVNTFVLHIIAAFSSQTHDLRASAYRLLEQSSFDIRLRGYKKEAVDGFIRQTMADINADSS